MSVSICFYRMGMSAKDVATRFLGIYEAQFEGLRQAGARVSFTLEAPDAGADFVVCTSDAQDIRTAANSTRAPLILYVPPIDQWFDRPLLSEQNARITFAYGPCLSQMTTDAYKAAGIAYHFLPFAADPLVMRPLDLPAEYDVVFLGGLQHRRGYKPFIEPLLKSLDPAKVAFIGGGWGKYGLPVREVHGLSADHPGPPERRHLTNMFYNLARVCINFHAPEEARGPAIQLDCNNRLFDLAMAGCVQVSDNAEAVRMHFGPGEVLAESSPQSWVNRVLECIALPPESLLPLRHAARARALAEHTWLHRGRTFLSWIDARGGA